MGRRRFSPLRLALALASLAACQTLPPEPPAASVERPSDSAWRAIALAADAERIDGLAALWEQALDQARAAGHTGRIAALGPTLEPEAGLSRPAPAPGAYRCRVIRFGADAGRRALNVYPAFFCHVGADGTLLSFTKQTGSERFGGYLFADGETRLVFLGTTTTAEEERAPAYGDDPARGVVGVVERVGPMRYRLAMPGPRGGALDVVEFVPAPPTLD